MRGVLRKMLNKSRSSPKHHRRMKLNLETEFCSAPDAETKHQDSEFVRRCVRSMRMALHWGVFISSGGICLILWCNISRRSKDAVGLKEERLWIKERFTQQPRFNEHPYKYLFHYENHQRKLQTVSRGATHRPSTSSGKRYLAKGKSTCAGARLGTLICGSPGPAEEHLHSDLHGVMGDEAVGGLSPINNSSAFFTVLIRNEPELEEGYPLI